MFIFIKWMKWFMIAQVASKTKLLMNWKIIPYMILYEIQKLNFLIVHTNQCYERNIYLRRPVQEIYL